MARLNGRILHPGPRQLACHDTTEHAVRGLSCAGMHSCASCLDGPHEVRRIPLLGRCSRCPPTQLAANPCPHTTYGAIPVSTRPIPFVGRHAWHLTTGTRRLPQPSVGPCPHSSHMLCLFVVRGVPARVREFSDLRNRKIFQVIYLI